MWFPRDVNREEFLLDWWFGLSVKSSSFSIYSKWVSWLVNPILLSPRQDCHPPQEKVKEKWDGIKDFRDKSQITYNSSLNPQKKIFIPLQNPKSKICWWNSKFVGYTSRSIIIKIFYFYDSVFLHNSSISIFQLHLFFQHRKNPYLFIIREKYCTTSWKAKGKCEEKRVVFPPKKSSRLGSLCVVSYLFVIKSGKSIIYSAEAIHSQMNFPSFPCPSFVLHHHRGRKSPNEFPMHEKIYGVVCFYFLVLFLKVNRPYYWVFLMNCSQNQLTQIAIETFN